MEIDKTLYITNRKDWRAWLEKNYEKKKGIWLIYYKKHTNKPTIPYDDAVEEALCFGWIDSTLKRIDEERYVLRYTPRKKKSVWSKINKETAERMILLEKMTEVGLAAINLAKKNGLWEIAYTNKVKEKLPLDLKKALYSDKIAWDNFQNFANSYRNMYIEWVKNAKTDMTRTKRICEVVKRSKDNKKPGII